MGVGDASAGRRFFASGVSSGSGVAFFFALDFAPFFDFGLGSFLAAALFFFVFGFALGDSFGVGDFSTSGVSLGFDFGDALFLVFGFGVSSSTSSRGVGDFFGFGDDFSFSEAFGFGASSSSAFGVGDFFGFDDDVSFSDAFGFGVGEGVFFFFFFGAGDSSEVGDALARVFRNSERFSSSLTCA
jgi:hypothetical protein